jgi:flagellar biosynthesis/type III secretory pathway ATPase
MAERDDRRSTGPRDLLRYTRTTAIVGDILKIRARDVGLGDMALVEIPGGEQSLAQAIQFEGDEVSLQVFGGGEGLSTQATVRFLGHPTQVTYSPNILGRVFRGDGQPMDGGPNLSGVSPGPEVSDPLAQLRALFGQCPRAVANVEHLFHQRLDVNRPAA